MIEAEAFLSATAATFYTGVPCSYLTPLINRVASSPTLTYVGAASEGEAVAIASGAWLGGRDTVVMCQNSGLGNAVNPLTSLNAPFRIPTLMIVTWRGEPGRPDEPQHEIMGQITPALLTLCGIRHALFPTTAAAIAPAVAAAQAAMAETSLPYAFIMQQGAVADGPLDEPPRTPGPAAHAQDLSTHATRPTRAALLECLLAEAPANAAIIATTGKCGRELFTLQDRDQHLYQVGSMGGASAMALGVALTNPGPVIVLDGDGAALMKLGSFATIGAYRPRNLIHILLDNGVHDSTGGQATSALVVDFAAVARATGYAATYSCDSEPGFAQSLQAAVATPGPSLIHARIRPGSMARLGRPTIAPHTVARRFQTFLACRND